MEANRKTSSDGSINASDKFEPERRPPGEVGSEQRSGNRAGGSARMGKETDGHRGFERPGSLRPSDTAMTEGQIIDACFMFKQVGERRSGARDRAEAVVLPFSVRSVTDRVEWAW
jgi:hypothetical protein